MYKTVFFLFLALPLSIIAQHHTLDASDIERIQAILQPLKIGDGPGGAVAIFHKGNLHFKEAYGMGDIRTETSLTLKSLVEIGDFQDQFIAYAVLQLACEQRLKLDAFIEQYIDIHPNLNQKIRIRNLLSHTSGLYNFESLDFLSAPSNEVVSIFDLIPKQSRLSFEPGTRFEQNPANLEILISIVEEASNLPFKKYMEEMVFNPIGMRRSQFIRRGEVKNGSVAVSYFYEAEDFKVVDLEQDQEVVLYTCLEDLITWEQHLTKIAVSQDCISYRLHERARLNDGFIPNGPEGQLTLGQRFGHEERGVNKFYSFGNSGGFASSIFTFPSKDFWVIVLSNNGLQYNGFMGMMIADVIIGDSFRSPARIDFASIRTLPLNRKELSKYEGFYWDASARNARQLRIVKDTLMYVRSEENMSKLLPIGKDKFQMISQGDEPLILDFDSIGLNFNIGKADPIRLEKFIPNNEISNYSHLNGRYFNDDYDISIDIRGGDNSIMLSVENGHKVEFRKLFSNLLLSDDINLKAIEIEQNDREETCITIQSRGIEGLRFRKT